MAQVFPRRSVLGVKLAFGAGLLAALATFATLGAHDARDTATGQPLLQPIAFSHKHHVSDDGIDCRYCHTSVQTSAYAGMPSSHTCLSCHSQLYRDAPMLAPLRQSVASGRPIAWVRAYKLPDFVFFDHSIHVAKGVGCVECHGRVDQMPLTWREPQLEMQWCLDCHRNPAPHLRPPEQVFMLDAPRVSAGEATQLVRTLHMQSTRRLSDCSTCHR